MVERVELWFVLLDKNDSDDSDGGFDPWAKPVTVSSPPKPKRELRPWKVKKKEVYSGDDSEEEEIDTCCTKKTKSISLW